MLIFHNHRQKLSDKFGVSIMTFASKLNVVKERKNVKFKLLFTNALSENYRFPADIKEATLDLDGLTVECIEYKKSAPKYALIHLHGGAYVLDYNDTYRKVAKKYLSLKPDLKVFSPIYSLAPRKPFPNALNEVVRLYQYILSQGYEAQNIVITGDSAGGGLAIATTLYLRDHQIPLPKALITMSAWTNLAMDGKSHIENRTLDPLFGEGTIPLNVKAYTKDFDLRDPYISPKYGDYSVFTDMLMFVGGDELIESDTLDVAEKAKENNEVIVHDFEGMFHVFPLGFNLMASSREAWNIIEEYLNKKLRR